MMKNLYRPFGILLFLSLFCVSAYAQTGAVRGFVYDKGSGEPLIFTNVILKGTTIGAATDVNGYYSITKVPTGDYTLFVTALGYDTIQRPITVKDGRILSEQIYLAEAIRQIKTFTISAERKDMVNTVRTGITKLDPKQIERMPAIGGEAEGPQT